MAFNSRLLLPSWLTDGRPCADSLRLRGYITPNASLMRIRNTSPVDFEQVTAEERRRAGILARLSTDPIERSAWKAVMEGAA